MQFNIVHNIQAVAGAFAAKVQGLPGAIGKGLGELLRKFRGELVYPPPAALPSYKRTYTLLAGMNQPGNEYVSIGTIIHGEYNLRSPDYAQYVVDETRQAWMHRGRWWTVQGKFREKVEQFGQFIDNAVHAHWAGW